MNITTASNRPTITVDHLSTFVDFAIAELRQKRDAVSAHSVKMVLESGRIGAQPHPVMKSEMKHQDPPAHMTGRVEELAAKPMHEISEWN